MISFNSHVCHILTQYDNNSCSLTSRKLNPFSIGNSLFRIFSVIALKVKKGRQQYYYSCEYLFERKNYIISHTSMCFLASKVLPVNSVRSEMNSGVSLSTCSVKNVST